MGTKQQSRWPITVGRISVDDLWNGDPRALANQLARLKKTLVAGLNSPGHRATLTQGQVRVALEAIGCAYHWLNSIPDLRRHGAAVEALRDPGKSARDRERLAINCLGGSSRKRGRPSDDNAWLVWAYRYLIGEVKAGASEEEQAEAWALAINAETVCGPVPTKNRRAVIEFLRGYVPGLRSIELGAIAKRLEKAGVKNARIHFSE